MYRTSRFTMLLCCQIAAACTAPSGGDAAASGGDAAAPPSGSGGEGGAGRGGLGGAMGGGGGVGGGFGASGGAGGAVIEPRPTRPFTLGGQEGWEHDEGFSSGYFHTYDALAVGSAGDPPRKVHVLLPRDYDASEARYPVVYMNDGNTTFWPGGLGNASWEVGQRLSELYAAGALGEIIVVAIHPLDREREYTHVPWLDGHGCCGLEAYTNYVADAVKGWMDAWYRTSPEPERTAIVGSSRGGLASFYMANRRPDRFGMAGCLSPSFWAGLDPVLGGDAPGGPLATSALLTEVRGTLSDPAIRPRLWIDWGLVRTGGAHNEAIEAAATARGREMVELLQGSFGYATGSELSWFEDPDGGHDEASWSRRFPRVMRALLGAP